MTTITAAYGLSRLYPLGQIAPQQKHRLRIYDLLISCMAPAGLVSYAEAARHNTRGSVQAHHQKAIAMSPLASLISFLRELRRTFVRYIAVRTDNKQREGAVEWSAGHAAESKIDQVVESSLGEKNWVARKAALIERSDCD